MYICMGMMGRKREGGLFCCDVVCACGSTLPFCQAADVDLHSHKTHIHLTTQEASLVWDRRALASALKAGQCSIEELKALASRDDASLSVKEEGAKGMLVGEYVRRMRSAARAVLKEEEKGM